EVLAALGPEAVRIQARTFARLVSGQIRETVGPGEGDPVEHYLSVLADKTGSLIATSALLGAWLAGADPDTVDGLRRNGETIGVAFQVSDDLLDVASDPAESGKNPRPDLRKRHRTRPGRGRPRERSCARGSGRCRCGTRWRRRTRPRRGCGPCWPGR